MNNRVRQILLEGNRSGCRGFSSAGMPALQRKQRRRKIALPFGYSVERAATSAPSLSRFIPKKSIMKSLKYYQLIAVFALNTVLFAPGAYSGTPKQSQQIVVMVRCVWCSPTRPPSRQTITVNSDGTSSVRLPKAGKYEISCATGPHKGEVLKTVTASAPSDSYALVGMHISH
jgi:hypothetical protein